MTGSERMHQRPIKDLVDAINSLKPRIQYLEKEGYLPIVIQGGGFEGGIININCSTSSQYISSILMASPMAAQDTEINLTGKSEPTSFSYIQMTIQAMRFFGATVEVISPLKYLVKNTGYLSPKQIIVEPDATSASYFFSLAALHQQNIIIKGLGCNSTQGELEFAKILEKMGCEVLITESSTQIIGKKPLNPVKVNMNNCTDSFIAASILMSTVDGISEIIGIENQKVKECNRVYAIQQELGKIGVLVEEINDGLRIYGNSKLLGNKRIKTYGDHRIAMGFSLLGTILPGIIIKERHAVNKTFPSFWKVIADCGIKVTAEEDKGSYLKNIVLVGMRGVGKSSLGKIISEELN